MHSSGTAEAVPFRFVPSKRMGWLFGQMQGSFDFGSLREHSLRMMVWVGAGDRSGLQPSGFRVALNPGLRPGLV
jgi:hypothetical protein